MPEDAELLDDLIAKPRGMQEHLALAEKESIPHDLLRGRIRHLYILAT